MRWFKKKNTVSLKDFSKKMEKLSKELGKDHWSCRAEMNGHGNIFFTGYVSGYWTRDHLSIESVIEDIKNRFAPQESRINEVEV